MTSNNNHWYGFSLSLLTAFLWGVLPITLKLSLVAMDAITITWYRFAISALVVFFLLRKRGALPSLKQLSRTHYGLLLIAGIGLSINYVAYVAGLERINPETAQVLIQLAPFLLMLCGIVLFKEYLSFVEKVGVGVLFAGLLLFFNDKIGVLLGKVGDYTWGILLVLGAALAWTAYALAQKVLLKQFTPKQLTLFIYVIGAMTLLPFSSIGLVTEMSTLAFVALLLCCLNTIFGYGAFAEALNVWQASKVSAVITLAPLFTFISVEVATYYLPAYFESSNLNLLSYTGGGLVVIGSMIAALGKSK
jgi:drug/metabolite transporter (DMT)-like permease